MRVVALVGKSGTGKSYKALSLAHKKEIIYIIDDGLLIRENKIIAGISAKREKTKISAVKRALFMDQDHREGVIEKLEEHSPDSILILGTSKKMVTQICENLKIGAIDEIIDICEIASEDEIKIAQESRFKQGKHVIPVPTFEIKKDFSGYFIGKLKIFGRKKDNTLQISERSVVRPTFSYMGKFTIYDRAIYQMIRHVSSSFDSVCKINRVKINNYQSGIKIDIELTLKYGINIPKTVALLQEKLKKEIEHMTSLNILAIDILVKNLYKPLY